MADLTCPICNTSIPVTRKALPHDHDVNGVRYKTKEFDVMVTHPFAKDQGLSRCEGSGAIFEIA